MADKIKVSLRDMDVTTIEKLKKRAEREGYESYNKMLVNYAERLANEDIVLASDQRYIDIAQRTLGELDWLSEVLSISILSGKLTSPLTGEAQQILADLKGEETDNG